VKLLGMCPFVLHVVSVPDCLVSFVGTLDEL